MKWLYIFSLLSSFAFIQPSKAQEAKEELTNCPCCADVYKQFDFWVGNWNVYDTTGIKVGRSIISIAEDSCLVLEKWKDPLGGTGQSMNFFDPASGKWKQTWVASSGYVIELEGGLSGGSMVMRSKIFEEENGKYFNQIAWTPMPDGTLLQRWGIFSPDGKLIRTLFWGVYKKSGDEK